MFPPPTGVDPSPEQIRELDDAYFSSDPFGYFLARIESLLAYGDGASAAYGGGLGAEYARRLRRSPEDLPHADADARELQVAIDAMSLRQHAAEAVVRLWAAALETRGSDPGQVSVWVTLTSNRKSMYDTLRGIGEMEPSPDLEGRLALLLPIKLRPLVASSPELQQAVHVLEAWLMHAEQLLTRSDLHLSAANNKVKHGMAVRARNDTRIEFVPADVVPTEGDTIPLDAVRSGVPLFDRPFVEYLAHPPRDYDGDHGLEVTQLRLDPTSLLAEATMLATVHAAVFHVAAARYAETSSTIGEIAPYPTLALGPTPQQLLGKSVVGMRSPVTIPPSGGPVTRGPGVGFSHGAFIGLTVKHGGQRQMTVRDD